MNAPVRQTEVEPVAELFAAYGDFVFRTLQYLGVPAAALDDALQDVFITAHRRWDAFEGRSTARTWLYGIARRVAFRYRRKDENRQRRFVLTERPVEGVDAPFDQANARRSVQALLEGLDEAKRAAFVLVEVEGFTSAEAAELLEVPLGTVYSRVRAAWARLRQSAQDDFAVATMRAELPESRRETLQRALVAACMPGMATAKIASSGILGGAAWLWGLGSVAVVGGAIALATRTPAAQPVPAPSADVAVAKPESPPRPQPSATPAATPPTMPTPDPDPALAAPPHGPAPSLGVAPSAAVPPGTRQAPAQIQTPPDPDPAAVTPTLSDELRLIRAAKEHARDGDPEQARTVLREHARRFPEGQLKDERNEVLRSLE